MPHIRQEGDYPDNWDEIVHELKEKHLTCQWCGVEGEKYNDSGKQLSVHHLDGDPSNPNARLVVLCAVCHLSDQHRVFYLLRMKRLEEAGQINMFLEKK